MSSAVDAVLYRPQRGVVEPGRMVNVLGPTGRYETFSYPDFQSLQADVGSLSKVAAFRVDDLNIGDDAGGFRDWGFFVTADYFEVLGMVPSQGIGSLATPRHATMGSTCGLSTGVQMAKGPFRTGTWALRRLESTSLCAQTIWVGQVFLFA